MITTGDLRTSQKDLKKDHHFRGVGDHLLEEEEVLSCSSGHEEARVAEWIDRGPLRTDASWDVQMSSEPQLRPLLRAKS